jgi:hypothetical protein
MGFKSKSDLPRHVEAKRLADGCSAYYWRVPLRESPADHQAFHLDAIAIKRSNQPMNLTQRSIARGVAERFASCSLSRTASSQAWNDQATKRRFCPNERQRSCPNGKRMVR